MNASWRSPWTWSAYFANAILCNEFARLTLGLDGLLARLAVSAVLCLVVNELWYHAYRVEVRPGGQ
jgi:hypothetical protein